MKLEEISARERSLDGNRALNASWEHYRVRHLAFSNDKAVRSGHRAGIRWLALDSVEQRYLLSCAADGAIAAHDTLAPSPAPDDSAAASCADHTPLFTITKQQHPDAHKSSISSVTWYPIDTGLFLSGGRDGTVKVWDANALAQACAFDLGKAVHAIAMSPAAASHCLVAVGSDEPDVALCDIRSGACAHRLSGHRAAVWTVAWSQENEWELVSGGREGQVRVWDIRRSGTRCSLDMHSTLPKARTMGDGSLYNDGGGGSGNVGGGGGVLHQPASTDNNTNNSRPLGGSVSRPGPDLTIAHDGGLTGLVPTPDGLYWLTAGNDDRVRLWHSSDYHNDLVHYKGTFNRASAPRQLAVSDDGAALFHPSGSAVQVFAIQSGKTLGTLKGGHFESINACVWSPVTSELFTGGNDNNIVVWAPKWASGGGGEGEDSDGDHWSE